MSTLINRVKDHISDNRGKYGAAAGAGAMYGASKIDSPLVNQAGFNILANGQNLALDTAAKIDPRATTALNDLGMHKIRPEDIDASNALYNSGVSKYINPNPVDMVNANERSTEAYNKAMAMKANAEDTLVNAKNQGQDYLDQGINYVKGLNPFSESTIPRKTMKIQIKQALLEGHNPEVIVEAVHNYSQKQRDTFIRRGIGATNTVNGKQFAANLAPIGGAIGGGAIGNQIHGDDGTIGGVTFDEQLNNDDEFDGTGALVGLAAGGLVNSLANSPDSSKTMNRLKNITNTSASPEERHFAKVHTPLVKTGNIILKGFEIGEQIRNKMQR